MSARSTAAWAAQAAPYRGPARAGFGLYRRAYPLADLAAARRGRTIGAGAPAGCAVPRGRAGPEDRRSVPVVRVPAAPFRGASA